MSIRDCTIDPVPLEVGFRMPIRAGLRDGVHRFNAEGSDDLLDKPRSGHPGQLSEDQVSESDAVVEAAVRP